MVFEEHAYLVENINVTILSHEITRPFCASKWRLGRGLLGNPKLDRGDKNISENIQ